MPPDVFRRALLIKLRHIGDVLLGAPVFNALKGAYPGIKTTALVPSGTEDMLTLNPDVDEVLVTDKKSGAIGSLKLLGELRKRKFDLAINMTEGDRGALIAYFSGAGHRIGVDPMGRGFIGKRYLFNDVVVPKYDGRHRVEMDLDLLGPLGIEVKEPKLAIYASDEDREFVMNLLAAGGVGPDYRYAVVHPTSRWMFKCWREEAVAETVDYLDSIGLKPVLTSGPDRTEREMVSRITGLVKCEPIDLSGRLSLKRLAALLQMAELFFGVDTAPMHMAAAAGTRVVALFGPSDSEIWGPYTDRKKVVIKRDGFDCIPCRQDGCDGTKQSRCLDAITVEDAVSAIDEVMALK